MEITERSDLVENSIEEILNQAWICVLSEISLGYTGNAHYGVRVSKEISVLAKVYIERYKMCIRDSDLSGRNREWSR